MKRIFTSAPAVILGSLIVGALLRFHHLSLRPLWLDEANSANFLKLPFRLLWTNMSGAESGPAYIYGLKLWSVFFGTSEFAIRSFSTVLGLASIIAIYFLGKSLFGWKAGLWSAFLVSVSYFSIFYSIQAHQYSAVILISILSCYYFVQIFSRNKYLDKIFFILLSVIGVYLHPWFFLLFFSQFIWILFFRKKRALFFVLLYLFIFLLSLPWIATLIHYAGAGVNDWIAAPAFSALFDTFHYFVFESGWVYIFISAIAVFFLFFEIQKVEQPNQTSLRIVEKKIDFKKNNDFLFLAIFLLFIPLFSAWIISQFFPFYVVGRYEAAVFPFFILLVAYFWSHMKNKFLIVIISAILILFAYISAEKEKQIIASYRYNEKTIAQELDDAVQSNDAVIFTGLSRPTFDYYFPRLGGKQKKFQEFSFPAEMARHGAAQSVRLQLENKTRIEQEADNLVRDLKESNSENIWLVYALNNPVSEILFEKMSDNFGCQTFLDLTLPENGPVSPLHFQKIFKCAKR